MGSSERVKTVDKVLTPQGFMKSICQKRMWSSEQGKKGFFIGGNQKNR